MTKVQTSYDLLRKLDDDDATAIGDVHGCYGVEKIAIAPGLDHITVDYDASRLSPSDLDSMLVNHGVPIVSNHRGED